MTRFPNFYKALVGNDMSPVMSYAVIEDGKIVVTNGKILIFCNFGVYVENPELAEGKVFDRHLLKWMTNKSFFRLQCTETGIIGHYRKAEPEEKPYSGHFKITEKKLENSRTKYNIRPVYLSGEDKETGNFPNWKSVIPNKANNRESTRVNHIGFNSNYLNIISGCFIYGSKYPYLKLKFQKKGAIHVSPAKEPHGAEGAQEAILMPYDI
ncbi:MAG: hypothetical protein LBT24_01395 [Tannerella sp.]|nr:hypothetical protein [Tannerella sp.]